MNKLKELTKELINLDKRIENCREQSKKHALESMRFNNMQREMEKEIPEVIKKIEIELSKEE